MSNNKNQNSYSKLFSNTLIFAIGSFSSKFLVFLLLPLYTTALSKEQFGTVDLLVQTANLIIPIATLAIAESVIRFGLDKKHNKTAIFSSALGVVFIGLAIVGVILPFISQTKFIKGYAVLLFWYVATACIKLVITEFIRAKQYIKLYAFNGILTTFCMILFNIIFLVGFKWNINGYLLAIILSDTISIIFLFFIAELWKYISIKSINKKLLKQMLAFSIPLMPAMVMWWITNVSDRFLVRGFLGDDANGLYAAAYKLPTIVTTIYSMFSRAWNISAITEYNSKQKNKFYTNVFNSNQSVIYVVAAGILLLLIPMHSILVNEKFFEAYRFTPLLVVAAIFTCYSTFLGSIYSASKKSINTFVTISVAGVLNIILNIILIPHIGINGASLATLLSYLLVFILRIVDVNRFVRIKVDFSRMILSVAIILAMAISLIFMDKNLYFVLIPCFALVLLINFSVLIKSMRAVMPEKIKRKIPFLRTK